MQEWRPQMPYVEQFPVAMAYVPWQRNCTMYENLDEAFKTGTIYQFVLQCIELPKTLHCLLVIWMGVKVKVQLLQYKIHLADFL